MSQSIFVDLSSGEFISSLAGGGGEGYSPFGTPFHQDILNLKIQPVDYSSDGTQSGTPYETLDASGYSISLLVTLASDGSTLAGPFTSWTPDGTALSGSADLNTVAMATAVSALDPGETVAAIFWLQISDGSTRKVTIETEVNIAKTAITSGTPSELPVTSYLTREECLALFVKFAGNPNGATITLTSPDGSQEVTYGATNAGEAAANQG